ncbi:MAG TPA: AAA family ATPase [Candidatus Binatia bacterium]|nr:AAA family ATPase [Candidatus Binatia bacterium]
MKILGIAGTNGSGKDTIGDILADRYGWLAVSVSDFLRQEAKKRNLPIEREVLRSISAQWRQEFGLGVLVDKAVDKFKKENKEGKYQGLVAIPMRNPGEAQHLKDLGGTLIWVDADPKVRYQRIYSRARSAEDKKTFEEFIQEEKDEMEHSGDHHTLSMSGVKAIADIFIQNSDDDIKQLEKTIEKVLNLN